MVQKRGVIISKAKYLFLVINIFLFCSIGFSKKNTVIATPLGITFEEKKDVPKKRKEEIKPIKKKEKELPTTGEAVLSLIFILIGMMIVMIVIGVYFFRKMFYENHLKMI